MTNHENFAEITGINDPVDVEAVKMLLSKIEDDIEAGYYESNCDKYLTLYKAYVKWLNKEAPEKVEINRFT